ncbi:xanthine dehydrogenase family protein molybdopterin-binding subunit [Actinoplanes derwentensis]|uniref:Xanthine dehydrogenase YagR molybdenum-binding subunit n=1 Tax=Actinoplanes derwentensis TaxID=113562 RepID=A0A1H1ZRY6_9ACTN|nr:xanthine dehydrogenase family protein molybdopterin-binding subunit [Actinoplanes derwentensis]GID89188.1 carbon-monoxide dehydrogenase large subunit [Actinoplanes derwentensis]SDT36555.1 xanthine dehydrogenase YagR molybdenum-binding subunit [Actinoplanes derwentensis]
MTRVDARDKVTGAVRFATDHHPEGMLHAALAVATIARGRVTAVHTGAAEAVPGVRLVLTRLSPDELRPAGHNMAGGFAVQSFQPLLGDRIAYRGQPIALVVADTVVAARAAADAVTADYAAEPAITGLDDEHAETVRQQEAIPIPFAADIVVGDPQAEYAAAPVHVDATYDHPAQNAAPLELLASIVAWNGDRLTVHEGTQNAGAVRHGLARQLGIDPELVRVVSPYLGGGFGQKNALQPHLGPLALAARRIGRPVRLELTRTQTFHQGSFRPRSRHRVRLGAQADGLIVAALHDATQQTSRHDLFPASYTKVTSRLYGYRAFGGSQHLVRTDVQTPGYMRAPYEQPAVWAFESAVDELAYALGLDPVALRLANDTTTDPVSGLRFSSRHVGECLRRGAELFGWAERDPRPGRMRGPDGTELGWGVAIGAYPASTAAASATIEVHADGSVTVLVDGHEMGQGLRSAVALLVAADLDIEVDRVNVRLGDTLDGAQHLTAGSWGTASALPAVHAALARLRTERDRQDRDPADPPSVATAGNGLPEAMLDRARQGLLAAAGPVYPTFTAYSFIAHFVEVAVEPVTRRIRVPRVVSVADCGRVASPVTAAAQVRGGVVWGLGGALREHLETDPRHGGFLNATLEDYPVTVNADIGVIDVDFVNRPDPLLNPLGVKGLGEVAMVGVAAAVANAVFHATGRRLRRLPIRLTDLL